MIETIEQRKARHQRELQCSMILWIACLVMTCLVWILLCTHL